MGLAHESSSLSGRTKINIYFNHRGFKILIEADPQFIFLLKSKFSSLNLINPKGYFSLIKILPSSILLIDNDYPFALVKYLDKNFDEKVDFKTEEASINIRKPDWII